MPHPDPADSMSMAAGCMKRFAVRPPVHNVNLIAELREFVQKWLKENMVPLSPDTDTSFETWCKEVNQPLWRREEYAEAYERVTNGSKWDSHWHKVKGHMKDESYGEYKFPRGINARKDEFKVTVGPIFKLIEDQLYKHPSFIKHVPVSERPRYIKDYLWLNAGVYFATDYTSFEALITPLLMEAVEFQLYEYMTSKLPDSSEFMRLIKQVLGGDNTIEYRDFLVILKGVRMSGEMCTSLGNGFLNLMLMLFVAWKMNRDVKVLVEGDDGLGHMSDGTPDQLMLTSLGLNIKMETHSNLEEASFCGQVFDREDEVVVTDPRKELVKFGWTSGRYARSGKKTLRVLLRCKALSLAYNYSGCPVLMSLAKYGLRVTQDVKKIRMYKVVNVKGAFSAWERDWLIRAMADEHRIQWCEPSVNTRLLVEKLYGLPVEQQIQLEKMLDAKTDLGPIIDETLLRSMPESWRDYWGVYVGVAVDERRPSLDVKRRIVDLPCVEKDGWFVSRDSLAVLRAVPKAFVRHDYSRRFRTL